MRRLFYACIALAVLAGCDDEDPSNAATTTGVGGNGSGGTGSGATGGSGPGGGGTSPCLPASEYDAVFSIDDPSLCVVASYKAPLRVGLDPNTFQSIVPTWGRHGGPLTMQQTYTDGTPQNEITLSRWAVPGDSGDLGDPMVEGPIAPSATATNPFINPMAVDLPFQNWTAVGWASFGNTEGEAVMLAGTSAAQRYPVAGLFAIAGTNPRLLHASITGLEDANGTQLVGVYATDICDTAPCDASVLLHAEGDASGPIALDQDQNLFALLPDIAVGDQALRGWEASTVAPQAAAHAGEELGTLPGSGTALAAIAPVEGSAGYVFLQPFDGNTFELGDVMRQRYRIEGTTVVVEGGLANALTLANTGAEVTLMSAPDHQLWVGVVTSESGPETTFFVLARVPE